MQTQCQSKKLGDLTATPFLQQCIPTNAHLSRNFTYKAYNNALHFFNPAWQSNMHLSSRDSKLVCFQVCSYLSKFGEFSLIGIVVQGHEEIPSLYLVALAAHQVIAAVALA